MMVELFVLGCTGFVVFLHGANFFFHVLSHHLAIRSLSFLKCQPVEQCRERSNKMKGLDLNELDPRAEGAGRSPKPATACVAEMS